MNKFKFEWQFMDGGPSEKVGSVEICRPKLTMEFQADGLDEIFRTFGTFLKGCGYEFKGDVVSEDYDWGNSVVTKYKNHKTKGNSEKN
jgi:hypothetical protein